MHLYGHLSGNFGMLGYGAPCAAWTRQPVSGVKPYLFLVASGDSMHSIASYFQHGGSTPLGPTGWGQLRDANPDIPVVALIPGSNVCVLAINPGDHVKIPENWPDPTDWSRISHLRRVFIAPNYRRIACPPGQTRNAAGQCVTTSIAPMHPIFAFAPVARY